MPPPIPKADGEVNLYNLSDSIVAEPRIYFVNGMRVLPYEHALTASYLSLLIERPIWGIHNKTAGKYVGSLVDLGQCLFDYAENAGARITSAAYKPAEVPEDKIAEFLAKLEKEYFVWNRATLALFRELVEHRFEPKRIIAHSQGNLIVSNALFILEDVLGSAALANVRVYSLASPSPGWPLSLRITNGGGGRQDNAFMNDLVALLRPHNLAKKVGVGMFQNAGDFRKFDGAWPVSLTPHAIDQNIALLNFLKSIRGDLGMSKDFTNEFLEKCATTAAKAFPESPLN